jgi:hypothetical protein
MRPCEGLEDSPWHDVASVYGYPGPVASGVRPDESFPAVRVECARRPLAAALWLSGMSLVGSSTVVTGETHETNNGGLVSSGQTVTIDLQVPESETVRDYQKILRQEIAGGRRLGLRPRKISRASLLAFKG